MIAVPTELREKAEQVEAGKKTSAKVRTLLDWFGSQRRRSTVVGTIREALEQLGLRTEPDFEHAYIDARVAFVIAVKPAVPIRPMTLPANVNTPADIPPESTLQLIRHDPTYRIGKLTAANNPPVSVKPDDALRDAVTLMLQHDFSQLPVMTSTREVKGMVSWKSLGSRLALGRSASFVRDFMETHVELSSDTSLFEAIPTIICCDCVLIRDGSKVICGIVSAADLCAQFRQLTEPFLLLNEVEEHIRFLIDEHFTVTELASARDPSASSRPVKRVADLTLGEYQRLLEGSEHFERLRLGVSREMFAGSLRKVLDIRNDVMHFDPDGVEETQLDELRRFVGFLQRLQKLT